MTTILLPKLGSNQTRVLTKKRIGRGREEGYDDRLKVSFAFLKCRLVSGEKLEVKDEETNGILNLELWQSVDSEVILCINIQFLHYSGYFVL